MYRFLNVTSFAPLIRFLPSLTLLKRLSFHACIIKRACHHQSDDEYTEFALLASHVFEVYVAHGRGIAAIALFPVFVLQVDAQYGFAALTDGDVAYKYILYQSAAAGTGLDADYAVQVGAVHAAVLNEQVAVAAGYFTADNDAAMTVFHEAAAHDDIFAGNVPLASVLVTAGFDGYAVVARIEGTVFLSVRFLQDSGSQPSPLGPRLNTCTPRTMSFRKTTDV